MFVFQYALHNCKFLFMIEAYAYIMFLSLKLSSS